MSPWLGEILKLLGLTTPLVYAAATFGLFHYLDKRASRSAKQTISNWLVSFHYDNATVASASVEIFDRIYTKPLLSSRALFRSITFTAIISVVCLIEAGLFGFLRTVLVDSPAAFVGILVFNSFSDFGSLFAIRPLLLVGGRRPFLALFFSAATGVFIVASNYAAIAIVSYYIGTALGDIRLPEHIAPYTFAGLWHYFYGMVSSPVFATTAIAGLVVHLWLPLYAISVLVIQLFNLTLKTAAKMQWFLKQGRHHPLDAIGYVAAGIVFLTAVIFQIIFH